MIRPTAVGGGRDGSDDICGGEKGGVNSDGGSLGFYSWDLVQTGGGFWNRGPSTAINKNRAPLFFGLHAT